MHREEIPERNNYRRFQGKQKKGVTYNNNKYKYTQFIPPQSSPKFNIYLSLLSKGKLELLTGGNQATMKLEVYDKNNKLICCPNEGTHLLGSYPIDDGMRLHVSLSNFLYSFLT